LVLLKIDRIKKGKNIFPSSSSWKGGEADYFSRGVIQLRLRKWSGKEKESLSAGGGRNNQVAEFKGRGTIFVRANPPLKGAKGIA